jgi:tetratricopeptide (TPR) repeat protein
MSICVAGEWSGSLAGVRDAWVARVWITTLMAAILLAVQPLGAQNVPATFTRDVAPILFARCVSCHRPGEIGGFSLLAFADARPRAAAIARVTRTRAMPPWKPDATPGIEFVGARRLTDTEIDVIQRWVADGALEGRLADLPPPPRFTDGWRLGTPDLVLSTSEPVTVRPGGPDLLRNVVIPVPRAGVRWVRGFELRPDIPGVVHHANVRIDRTRKARWYDAADPAPGFDGRLNAGSEFPDGQFLGWTPGQLPPPIEGDAAWRLDPGSDLVVQLHLRPTDRLEHVQIRIGFFFAERPPTRTPVMVRLGRQDIDIPPGAVAYRTTDSYRLPVDTQLLAIQPHAHFRAREVTATATLPDGRQQTLIHIGDWDFDWQDQYRYTSPVALPAGTILQATFRYDNSAANPKNPDFPPRRVRWGQNSSDEMGDVWLQLVTSSGGDRQRLVDEVGRKVLLEDAVGYETLIDGDPVNPRLHEAAAALLLTLGEIARGIDHLEAALRLDPRSAEAHYNLATALAWQGRRDDAVAHLRQALATAPDHVGAHVNLGALLRARGDRAEAIDHLRQALAVAPGDAVAHANLGGLLLQEGRITQAVQEFRAALETNPNLLEPLTELAWTFATSPSASLRHPDEAVTLAERAQALTHGDDVRVLDALAAAYASAERYSDAVGTAERALERLRAAPPGAEETERLLTDRLLLYRQRRPVRDPARQER